jgi:putative transposase
VKFNFIAAESAVGEFSVAFMCRELGVSSSGYYAHKKSEPSQRRRKDLALMPMIRREFDKYPRGCGSRTVLGALRHQGTATSRKRIVRLMAECKLHHRLKRRYARPPRASVGDSAENVLDRAFDIGRPMKAWAADITCLHTTQGWAYLAVVLDLGTRKVVGWAIAPTMVDTLAVDALEHAIGRHRPPVGLVHHSDRGSQYMSLRYQQLLLRHGMTCSMSRKGNCWDNACVESFFSSLKRELPTDVAFTDWRAAERAVFAYIEAFYNSTRRHSTLDYLTPNEYERTLAA